MAQFNPWLFPAQAAQAPLNFDFNTEQGATNILEALIGAPVAKFVPPNDYEKRYIQVYQFFKPCIYYVYSAFNNNFEEQIKKIMRRIILILRNRNPLLLVGAIRVSLLPPKEPANNNYQINNDAQWTGANLNTYVNLWYQYLFVDDYNENTALKLVIQGGEAVNRYTHFFDENVPTHDCDTRILVGNHFNYLRPIGGEGGVPDAIKQRMHRYRFLTLYGVISEVAHFYDQLVNHSDEVEKQQRRDNYANQIAPFLPGAAAEGISFCVTDNDGTTYDQIIIAGTYSINNDSLLKQLECVTIIINNQQYTLVDTFLPYKTTMLGHTYNLHKYFTTDQSISASFDLSGVIIPSGSVPHIKLSHVTQNLPYYGTRGFHTFIVPIGYLLWDTMRMLLVSKRLQMISSDNKLLKYRQKLNVLMTNLVDKAANASESLFFKVYPYSSRKATKQAFLLGGGNNNTNSNANATKGKFELKNKALNSRNMSQDSIQNMPLEMLREAKALSKKFRDSEHYISSDLIKTPVEFAAYMDYLHSVHGGWSEFRLPLLAEEKEKIKGITATKDMFKGYEEKEEEEKVKKVKMNGGFRNKKTIKKRHKSSRGTKHNK